ncbi:MAG TPA: DUF2332 domain-containing protein [Streptosporangiaceae bacterium]
MAGTADIRAQALEVAAGWSPPDAPRSWQLTAALFRAIAAHDELLGELARLPPGRLPALLASAAVAHLVRRNGPDPLAGYFPEPGGRQPGFDDGFYPLASSFFSENIGEIMATCRQHAYQMNEVARCAQIALGVAAVAPAVPEFALADLGTGAGLGLHLDRYRYQVGDLAIGPRGARLLIDCELRGAGRPPASRLPAVARRAGIELSPVDLDDPAAREWLQSCAPPEASALNRLTAAMEVAVRHPARIVPGDAIAALPAVLAGFPPDLPVVVTDSYLAVFLTAGQLDELAAILAEAGRTRPVTWLSLDPLVPLGPAGRLSVQQLPLPGSLVSDYQQRGVFAVLGARTFTGGTQTGRLLARAHPSGQWVEWLG